MSMNSTWSELNIANVTVTSPRPRADANECGTVHDIGLHKPTRLAILYLTIIIGLIGCCLVLLYMCCNRRITPRFNHLSRVNAFILNLTFADLLVILVAVLPQLAWEYVDREWSAGPVMCRTVKFLQSFSMMSSNYILIVIAIDRHQAIIAPLKESWPVWKMAGLGWIAAAVCSLPMFGVFRLNTVDGQIRCENIFRDKPKSHRQAWIAYICFSVFFIPLLILIFCYTRIFLKVARKANENKNRNTLTFKRQTGKVYLQSTESTSLPRAKTKTLKLTFAIIVTFIIVSMPYFVVEMIMSFGNHCIISQTLYGLLGGMAACNSAANPYIYLAFNVTVAWIRDVRQRYYGARRKKPRFVFSANSSVDSQPSLKYFAVGSTTNTFVN